MTSFMGSSFGDPGVYPTQDGGNVHRSGTVDLNANTGQYQSQMNAAASSTAAVSGAVGNLLTKVDSLYKYSGRTLEIISAADVATLTGAVAQTGQLRQEMGTLAATTAVNHTSMNAYGKAVDQVFSKFPQHQADVVGLVTQLANLSVSRRDIDQVATSMTKLGYATGEAIPALTADLVQLDRQMGVVDSHTGQMANSLLVVSKNAGVGAGNVLSFANSIAPIARQAGIGEKAVLGISTAFTKAGADGFYAANTFNSIVNDITTLTRTGSPELAKYASFVGMTVDQFRRLPAKEQITDIFQAISQGGPKALNFVQELGLGTRALTSVQAVAQQGGLSRYISIASGAHGTGALDRGAGAATNNLPDIMAKIRNQFVILSEHLGGPFMTVVDALTSGLEHGLSAFNHVVDALGPLPGLLAALAAPLTFLAGLGLSHIGVVGAIATARLLMGAGGAGIRTSFNEGRQQSTLMRAQGMSAAEAAAATGGAPAAIVAGGGVRWRTSAAVGAGRMFGYISPTPSAEEQAARGSLSSGAGAAVRGAGGLAGWFYGGQARMIDDSMRAPRQGSAYAGRPEYGAGPRPTPAGSAFIASTAQMNAFGVATGRAARSAGEQAVATEESTGAVRESTGMLADLAAGARSAASGLVRLGTQAASYPRRMLGMGSGGNMMAALGLAYGAQMLGGAIDNGQAGSGRNVAGTALTDAGTGAMLGTFISPGLGTAIGAGAGALFGGLKSFASGTSGPDPAAQVDAYLNPIQRYSQALGTTSSNLATFGRAVNDASTRLSHLPEPTTLHQAAHISPADITAASTAKYADPAFGVLAHRPGGASAAVSYIQGLALNSTGGTLTPQSLGAIRQDVAKAFGMTRGNAILAAYLHRRGATPDLGQLGTDALGAGNTAFKTLTGSAITAIQNQTTGGMGDRQARLVALGRLLTTSLAPGDSSSANERSLAAMIQATLGLKRPPLLIGGPGGVGNLISALMLAPGGNRTLHQAGITGADLAGLSHYNAATLGLSTTFSNPVVRQGAALAANGPLGAYMAGSTLFGLAAGKGSSSPAIVQRSIEEAAQAAVDMKGSTGKASVALLELAQKSGGVGSAMGDLLNAAAAWTQQLLQERLPYMSRGQQGSALRENYLASRQAYQAAGNPQSGPVVDQYKNARSALISYRQSQQQYLISMGQQLDAFHVQQLRSEQDYELSVYRSNRDFQISMVQSEQDYLRQRGRSLQDFNIQMAREAQSAAENIYNPFAAVQVQQVASGGIVVGNLEDQNRRIIQQERQVRQLRSEGLSQAAVDTLQLDNPANAQQTNSIARSVINDPKTIARINQLISTRQSATTALTQSQYNEQFRNTVADFERGLNRTESDYNLARQRAVDAQNRSLGDMAYDFNTMVTRSGQDLTTQMTELYGTFAEVYARTLTKINGDIANQFPALARMLRREIKGIGSGGGVPGAPSPGSTALPNTTAGVVGINPQGQTGFYGTGGVFHQVPLSTLRQQGTDTSHLPHIAPPGSMDANSPAGAQAYAQSQLRSYGWSQSQMAPLLKLWNEESGWSYTAYNSGSGAVGIPQLLPRDYRGHHNSSGHVLPAGYLSDGRVQINWGLDYIKSRYGTPSAAWAFETSHSPNWYAAGSIFKGPRRIGVGEAGPEAVIPLTGQRGLDFMAPFIDRVSIALMQRLPVTGRGMSGSAAVSVGSYTHSEDHSIRYEGDIIVQPTDVADMERQLAERARLARLTQPAHPGG